VEKVEKLADLVLELLGMAHAALGVEDVAVATADALTLEIPGRHEVVDDPLSRSLGYANRARDITQTGVGLSMESQQDLRVAREEVPRTVTSFRT
jgi:hypothetical protein